MTHALIIEDDCRVAEGLAGALLLSGVLSVEIAGSESDAVAAADRLLPSIIISDVDLKEGGRGPVAVERIHARHGMVPVVFVTSDPQDEQARAMAAAVLAKPVTFLRLVSTVRLIAGEAQDGGASGLPPAIAATAPASIGPCSGAEGGPDDPWAAGRIVGRLQSGCSGPTPE